MGRTASIRLLIGAGDGASFAGPATGLLELTSATVAGHSEPQWPKAIGHNGYTYYGGIDGTNGDVGILAVNDSTLATSWTVIFPALGGEGTADLHDNSAVIVLSGSGKLATFTCRHADNTGVRMRISTSSLATDPMLTNGFASTVLIDFGTLHDYPVVVLFDSKLWLFCREIPSGGVDAHLRYKTTTDLSAATGWSATTDLYNSPGKTAYWQINADDDFIHVLTFDDNEADSPDGMNDLKHFKVNAAGARFQSDGDSIAASLPLEPGDIDTITASTGGHHLWNLELFAGNPVATVNAYPSGFPSGTGYIRRLEWNGAAWVSTDVASISGTGLQHGCAIHPEDKDRVLVTRFETGVRDLLEYTYNGTSWSSEELAPGVSGDDDWIFPVAARSPGRIKVIVMRGNYDSYTDWASAVWAIVED
jgi:hypothetical protein